jgi:hypothetical protein
VQTDVTSSAMSSYNSVSSHNANRRKSPADDIDRSTYHSGQSLITAVNDPRVQDRPGLLHAMRFSRGASMTERIPSIDEKKFRPIARSDLDGYLTRMRGKLAKFYQNRQTLDEHRVLLVGKVSRLLHDCFTN